MCWLYDFHPLVLMCSAKDFDSTGEYHKQYAAKWMKYLQSTIPETYHSQCSASSESSVCGFCFIATCPPLRLLMQTVDSHGLNIKYQLDAMLKKWEPKEFKPAGARPISKRVCSSQFPATWLSSRTHKMNFSTKALFNKNTLYGWHSRGIDVQHPLPSPT